MTLMWEGETWTEKFVRAHRLFEEHRADLAARLIPCRTWTELSYKERRGWAGLV